MKKNKKRVIAIITIIIIALGILLIVKNISIEKEGENSNEIQEYTPQEEISEEQLRQTKIILYFANTETGNLESEIKLIDAKALIENPCREIIELLIKGPQSTSLKKLIPEGTILNDVKIENSCAIINFSNEFLNYETDENKTQIINSIVNTLTNLKEINSVKFLINGEANEKLAETYVKNKE